MNFWDSKILKYSGIHLVATQCLYLKEIRRIHKEMKADEFRHIRSVDKRLVEEHKADKLRKQAHKDFDTEDRDGV